MTAEYMEPGPELDALVQSRVFPSSSLTPALYSTSFEDMELLVDKLAADHWYMQIEHSLIADRPYWACMYRTHGEEYIASGVSMPHVLALCAVKAYRA